MEFLHYLGAYIFSNKREKLWISFDNNAKIIFFKIQFEYINISCKTLAIYKCRYK